MTFLCGKWRRTWLTAQIQHEFIIDTLIAGEGSRVEALMKEHSNVSKDAVRVVAETDGEEFADGMVASLLVTPSI